jgi:hypothetical protein
MEAETAAEAASMTRSELWMSFSQSRIWMSRSRVFLSRRAFCEFASQRKAESGLFGELPTESFGEIRADSAASDDADFDFRDGENL